MTGIRATQTCATRSRGRAHPLESSRAGAHRRQVGDFLDVQRTAGNHALGELLGADAEVAPDVGPRRFVAATPAQPAPPAPPSPPGGGQPLESGTRHRMETRFGADFSGVRIHADPAAAAAANHERANAFSVGQDIVFGAGRFDPGSPEGEALLSHELTHVVQQSRTGPTADRASGAEREADAVAVGPDAGRVAIQEAAPVGIQRAPAWWTAAKTKATEYADKGAQAVDAALDKAGEKLADAAETITEVTQEAKAAVKDAYVAAKETAAEVKTAVVETARDAKAAVVEKAREIKAKAVAAVRTAKAKASEAATTITTAAHTVKEKAAREASSAFRAVQRKAADRVMRSVGQAKGVLLEATNLIDSVAWLDYQARKWTQKGVEKGLAWAEKKEWISKETHAVAGAVYGEQFGTAKADRLREAGLLQFDTDAKGKLLESGGPTITGTVSPLLDKYADMLGTALGATPESEVTFFTEYETGEVEGALGTQVALAYVGAEEVQLVLKGLGAIGGAKGLILSIERGDDWLTIGVNALNLVLAVIGLAKGKAAQKIVSVASKIGAVASLYPPLKQLYAAYKSPKETSDPAAYRRELFGAAKGVITAGHQVVMSIIHARPGKAGTPAEEGTTGGKAPSTTPAEGPTSTPGGTGTESQPGTPAPTTTVQPPPEVVAPTPKPVAPQPEIVGGATSAAKPPVPVATETPPPPVTKAPPAIQTETAPSAKPPPVQAETPPPATTKPPSAIAVETTPPATKAAPAVDLEATPPAATKPAAKTETETPPAGAKVEVAPESGPKPAPAAAAEPTESETPPPAARSLVETKAARARINELIESTRRSRPSDAEGRAARRAAFEAALEESAYPKNQKGALRAELEAALEPPSLPQQAKVAVGQDVAPGAEQVTRPPLALVPTAEAGSTPTVAAAGGRLPPKPTPLPPARPRNGVSASTGSTEGRLRDQPPPPKPRAPAAAAANESEPRPEAGVKKLAAPTPEVSPAAQLEALEDRASRTLQGHPDADRVAKLVVEAHRLAKDPSKANEAAAAVAKVRAAIDELEGAPVLGTGAEGLEGESTGLRLDVVWEPPPGATPRPPDSAPAAVRTEWLRERLQQHVDAAKARYEEAGLTTRQEAAAQNDPRAVPRFRGSRIDEFAKSSVLQDPDLARVITAPDFIREPDFIDASLPSWFDITTRQAWAAHLRKYSATHGSGTILPTNPP